MPPLKIEIYYIRVIREMKKVKGNKNLVKPFIF